LLGLGRKSRLVPLCIHPESYLACLLLAFGNTVKQFRRNMLAAHGHGVANGCGQRVAAVVTGQVQHQADYAFVIEGLVEDDCAGRGGIDVADGDEVEDVSVGGFFFSRQVLKCDNTDKQ
jgi:hypothetical protein